MARDTRRQGPGICTGLLCGCALSLSQGAPAQVVLDGTLGPAGPLAGPDYLIPDNLGEAHGSNLFHSFADFSLTSSESATFTGPPDVLNVIARVTGGEVSTIDGTLATNIRGADLYLLNPRGVMFGENAQLNLDGSFYASTADHLRLADGGRFDASLPAASTLSAAAPAAFGFLGPPAPIEVAGTLAVNDFQTIALAGGDITVRDTLAAPTGRVELAAVAAAGEVPLSFADGDFAAFETLGEITLTPGALLSTAGSPGGTILIRGGRLALESAALDSTSLGGRDHAGTGVDIVVRGELEMRVAADPALRDDAFIDTSSADTARAGDIRIEAGSLRMTGESGDGGSGFFVDVLSRAGRGGRSGDILIDAGAVSLGTNAIISTYSFDGRAGDITVNADSLELIGTAGSGTFIESFGELQAEAGDLTVSADEIYLQGGADAPVGLSLKGNGGDEATGSLRVSAGRVQIVDGAEIRSRTLNPQGGHIEITADLLSIAGADARGAAAGIYTVVIELGPASAGNIDIDAGTLSLRDNGIISANLDAIDAADSAQIRIQAQEMTLASGASLLSQSNNFAAGSIAIEAATLRLEGGGGSPTDSRAVDAGTNAGILIRAGGGRLLPGAEPPGGVLRIDAADLQVLDGARIDTSTSTLTAAGSIEINGERVTVAGRDAASGEASTITSSSAASRELNGIDYAGPGGDIAITARDVTVRDGAILSVESRTPGAAGDLRITAGTISLSNGASISANASGSGDAGDIALTASESLAMQDSTVRTEAEQSDGGNIELTVATLISLQDSAVTASVRDGVGDGGNISIDPDFLILNRSRIAADAVGGAGGNVSIVAGQLLVSADSSITASSALGVQGNVVVRAPSEDFSGKLEKLPESALDAASRFRTNCAAIGSRFSSFTVPPSAAARSGTGAFASAYPDIGAAPVARSAAERLVAGVPSSRCRL